MNKQEDMLLHTNIYEHAVILTCNVPTRARCTQHHIVKDWKI
jgi:hypothetical protein